ncbi:hypothetical protein [Roseivivax sp. THAF40]|uniref:hypothetical protein n=1 Tax=Roseivivax sp. THAF40 TaxID=2587858 RepID=UPI00126966ED|nr:hypothetical protein [Roseivivax sp. THAF40]
MSRKLMGPRRIDIGYGVAFHVRPFTFADFKNAEASAVRIAEESRSPMDAAAVEAIDEEDMPPEVEDAFRGDFAQALLLVLLQRYGEGWEGVETEAGTPASFDRRSILEFLDLFPGAGQTLQREILLPFHVLVSEGNGSAPSQDTASAEA